LPDKNARGFGAVWIATVLLVAALVTGVALWRSFQLVRSVALAEAVTPGPPEETLEIPGFRSDAWFLPADSMLGFVEIPAGPFLMGSDPTFDRMAFENERWSPEATQGTVELTTYYIGRFEVTKAQFRAFVEKSGYTADPSTLVGEPDHPVVNVSWPDAMAYARWLEETLREGSETPSRLGQLLRAGWRISLPSEAQWEKAARGSDGRIFPWGNEPSRDLANYQGSGTTPVGRYRCVQCSYGLADMSGNVWEWTRSPFQPLPYDTADDRADLESDALWVMRGGSYDDPERNVRAAIRGGADPGVRRAQIGFRLALLPP